MSQTQGNVPVGSIKLDATKVEVAKVFKCSLPHSCYVFKNGKRAVFTPGKDGKYYYATKLKGEIDALTEEVEEGHPHIYVDKDEPVVEVMEPMEALRQRIIDEYLESTARSLNKKNDAGNSVETKLTPANSYTISEAAGSSDSFGEASAPASSETSGLKINLSSKGK